METLVPPDSASPVTKPELQLLLERDPVSDWRRWRAAGIVSFFVHLALLVILLLMPESVTREDLYEERHQSFIVTPLYTPPDVVTQKAPNKGPLSKMITAEAIPERPKIKAPSPAPAAKKAPPSPPIATAPKIVPEAPKVAEAEPPKVQAQTPPNPTPSPVANANVSPPPPVEQPRIVLENLQPPPSPTPGQATQQPRVVMPNTSVDAVVRDLAKGGVQGVQSVGDLGADEGGFGAGLNLPPSAGKPRSNLELKSDPMGVDFRPYMLQVLAAVRQNWFAVYPEAARLGQRGEVILEFAIAKSGVVTKVIFSSESGAKALDQSAVAAISASNPLPSLPPGFKGDRIVLRMTFMYNIRR